ncbi:phosphoethanolamine transferase [Lysobacter sp. A378]
MSSVALPASVSLPRVPGALRHWRPQVTVEVLAMLASGYFALACNLPFWHAALTHGWEQWRLALALFVLLFGLHGLLLGVMLARPWAKAMLMVLFVVTACATYYMQSYGVYVDADMLRNVLHTDWAESRELLTPGLCLHLLLYAGLPGALLSRVEVVRRPMTQALMVRAGFLLLMWVLMMIAAALSFKDVSSLMRNQHEVRYLVTPGNYLYGLGNLVFSRPAKANAPLLPVAEDAHQIPLAATRKPRLLVLVVGETVRAQNWGLNGYERQTTPELARQDVVNFGDMQACGSSTEVSLPCMFSPYGRRDYDEEQIRAHQSLLHVLQRVGVDVLWRDNQSGCKGVCDGLKFESVAQSSDPAFCNGLRCLDEILLKDMPTKVDADGGDKLIVLHMLGNHGPSYFQRYPPEFKRFLPACEKPELGRCSREEIVNAYDNAVLYTDHVLSQAIARLHQVDEYDAALIYLSDHGESLGENGLYLHGMPYAIAPQEQLRVPMVMWFSPQFAADVKLDRSCLRDRSARPASHDNLFSTVLGLFDVQTSARVPELDLLAACRNGRSDDFPTPRPPASDSSPINLTPPR